MKHTKTNRVLGFCFALVMLIMINSCKKNVSESDTPFTAVSSYLEASMLPDDYAALDWSRVVREKNIIRVGFNGKDPMHDAVIVLVDTDSHIVEAKILHVEGSIEKAASGKKVYNGWVDIFSLDRTTHKSSAIVEGFITALHQTRVGLNATGIRLSDMCADCTIPEVTVATSYKSNNIDWYSVWMNLSFLLNYPSTTDNLLIDLSAGAGGNGSDIPILIDIDPDNTQNKEKIDPKKYTDCFGSIPDGSTTIYSLTISADLPVDGHPDIFYNWSERSPGHAFIELSKSTPYGGVTQSFGFYPTSSYKLATLENINLDAKIVDDGGHEYQASYTIAVTAAQFQAAINAVNNARTIYNVGRYNCTDFALDVFNAAGGNLSIPKFAIPGFEVDGGSHTPQGLFQKIKSLRDNGTAGTTTTHNKEYEGTSKGPCN